MSDTSTRRPRRRIWVWAGRAILFAVLGLGSYFGWSYYEWRSVRKTGEGVLATATAELDASDPDWRSEKLFAVRNASLPPSVANSAELALQARALIPDAVRVHFGKPDSLAFPDTGVRPHPEYVAETKEILGQCRAGLEAMKAARGAPKGGVRLVLAEPDPLKTPLEHLQQLRLLAAVYGTQSLVDADAGRIDPAMDSASAILEVAQCIGDEPLLLSQLIRVAIAAIAVGASERALGLGEATPETLAKLQTRFLGETEVPRLVWALRGERATMHTLLEKLDSGAVSLNHISGEPASLGQSVGFRVVRKHIPAQQATLIRHFNAVLVAARLPLGPTRTDALEVVYKEVLATPFDPEHVFLRLFPAVPKLTTADLRVTASLRCAAAALACERLRLKTGRFPETLAELPKEMLVATPEDPFTGTALLYEKSAEGVKVYSVGVDGIDDGGNLAFGTEPGTDLGFRLLEPKLRRQPHAPKTPADPMD